MLTFAQKCLSGVEFAFIYASGKIFGIGLVIRYLRNPGRRNAARLLRAFGATIGEHTTIKHALILDNVTTDKNSTGDFRHLVIGQNCYLGDEVFLDLSNQIFIADNVVVSGRVSMLTHSDCNRSAYLAQKFPRRSEPIRIESGAWVGFGATILAGVTIAAESVIGACALVTENTESRAVYFGIPAKKTSSLEKGA